MRIKQLHLENFARHGSLDLDFAPGLTIVRGANEAGKSTVQRALEMVLFRRSNSTADDLDRLRPWGAAQDDPEVSLDFDDEGAAGSLRKVFAGQRGTVELRLGGEDKVMSDPGQVEQEIARLTGLPSEKFFRATASVHHQELAGLTQDESTLRDRLQQSMSGADRGTHAARRKLEEAIRRYRSEGAKNPGYLKSLRGEVERLQADVSSGEAALKQLAADREALAAARGERTDLEARLVEERAEAEKAERAVELTRQANEASSRYLVYRRASELRSEMSELETSHPTRIPLATLRAAVDELRGIEFRLSEMRAELAAEPDLSGYDVAIPKVRWRPWAFAGGAALLLAVVALAGGALAGSLPIGIVAAIVLGVLGAAALVISMRERTRVGDVRLQNELRESEIARRLHGRTELAEKVRTMEHERATQLEPLGVDDVAAAETLLSAETEHTAKIAALQAEYRGLTGADPGSEDVAELRDKAAAEADECKHTLAGMGEIGRDPERHLATHRLAIERLTPEREAALQAEAQAEARVAANDADAERVAADSESLGAATEQLEAAERRLRIYEQVLSALNGAEQATMKKAARFLEQRMAGDVERITGGRYRRLKVDESSLTFTVYAPELADWVDVRQLSQGTLDQLYLCARLGIVRQVTAPASPPLVFDDPFVTFDDDRAQRAMALLHDLSREHQIVLLTSSDRYDEHADKVIELAPPTARDEPEPEPPAAKRQTAETISMWSSAPVARAPISTPKER